MRRSGLQVLFCSLVLLSATGHAQVAKQSAPQAPADPPSAQDLLRQTASLYAKPGRMHVETIEESHESNDLMDKRSKILRKFEQGAGNRWRVETHAPWGAWLQISDGKTEWRYWLEAKAYEEHPAGTNPTHYRGYFGENQELINAVSVAVNLESMATDIANPRRLPDETITLGGQALACYVVQVDRTAGDKDSHFLDTMWLDKGTHLIRKVLEDNHSYLIEGDVHVPFHEIKTLTFSMMELNAQVPDSEFVFTPVAGTKKVDTLEPQWARESATSIAEKARPADVAKPEVIANAPLVGNDGNVTTLDAYRGKVVLVDFWATWCGPCMVSMPGFAAMVESLKGADLTVLSVDEDESRAKAFEYMGRHGYTWTNLHDRRSGLQTALGIEGIPRTVLLDRTGKVVFSESVADGGTDYEAKLRAALAKTFSTTFEVASIKASAPNDLQTNINVDHGRFSTESTTLVDLLKLGYALNTGSDDQIVGAPSWVGTARFDINAKVDDATAAEFDKLPLDMHRIDAVRPMIQSLLVERFHLKVHTEIQPRTVTALVIAKGGSKLTPSTACVPASGSDTACVGRGFQGLHNNGQGHLEGRAAGIGLLVNNLSAHPEIGGRMVVDQTGLTGKYDFDLQYTPERAAAETPGISLFEALQEQLGLKLESKKLPIPVLVIDRVERPSAN